jgi:DNA repair exonuclease SbcCD ATPase subunit
MLIFKKIKIQNYNSIEDIEFNLDKNGFVLISGINKDGENTQSNGSGKSSLLEAIYWVLYGADPEGYKKEIVRSGQKKCIVELFFNFEDKEYYIIRTREGINHKLEIYEDNNQVQFKDSVDSAQKYLTEMLEMDKFLFKASIYYSPNSLKFFDESFTDVDRKNVLLKSINVDELLNNALRIAKNMLSNLKEDLNKNKSELDNFNYQKDLLNLISLEKNNNNFAQETKNKINDYKDKIKEIDKIIKNAQETIIEKNKLQTEIKNLEVALDDDRIKKLYDLNEKINEKINEHDVKINKFAMKKESIKNEVEKNKLILEDRQNHLDILKSSDKCPVCLSQIDKKYKEGVVRSISKEYFDLLKLNKGLMVNSETQARFLLRENEAKKDLLNKKTQIRDKINKINEDNNIFKRQLEDKKYKVKDLEKKIENLARYNYEKEELIKKIDDLKNIKNPYEDMYKEAKEKERNIKREINIRNVNIHNLEENIWKYEWWVNGFGSYGIQNYIIQWVVEGLNKEIKKYLSYLSGNEINAKICYSMSGRKTDMKLYLEVEIKPHGIVRPSKGQRRKIDLAMNFALSHLLGDKNRITSNIIILDEVLDGIDMEGKRVCIDLIKNLNKESIFLISHELIFEDVFDKKWIVIKENGISKLES